MRTLGFPSIQAVAIASGVAISLFMASGVQVASSFNAQTRTLTIPAVIVPASCSPTDQTVFLPAIAVQGAEGRHNYFDIKLNGLNGNFTSFAITGMNDPTTGAPVQGPREPPGG